MKTIRTNRARWGQGGLVLGLILTACGKPMGPGEISETRVVPEVSSRVLVGADSDQRFAPPGVARQQESERGPAPFVWATPSGWNEVPARSSLRVVDFSLDRDPSLECYMVAMRGDGGGLLDNVNRWRVQMGVEKIDQAGLATLASHNLFGSPAPLVEVAGNFDGGMGGTPIEGGKLLGLVHSFPQFTVFVKMTGKAEAVDAERDSFLAFCESISVEERPGMGAPAAAPASNWQVPSGWQVTPPRTMRLVNFLVGDGTECYVTVLGGNGGGLLANVNRWLKQVGEPPIDEGGLAALPRQPILGRDGLLVEANGDYTGMTEDGQADETKAAQGLLGIMVELPDKVVFVKMVGPADVVSAQRSAFFEFTQSITPEDV